MAVTAAAPPPQAARDSRNSEVAPTERASFAGLMRDVTERIRQSRSDGTSPNERQGARSVRPAPRGDRESIGRDHGITQEQSDWSQEETSATTATVALSDGSTTEGEIADTDSRDSRNTLDLIAQWQGLVVAPGEPKPDRAAGRDLVATPSMGQALAEPALGLRMAADGQLAPASTPALAATSEHRADNHGSLLPIGSANVAERADAKLTLGAPGGVSTTVRPDQPSVDQGAAALTPNPRSATDVAPAELTAVVSDDAISPPRFAVARSTFTSAESINPVNRDSISTADGLRSPAKSDKPATTLGVPFEKLLASAGSAPTADPASLAAPGMSFSTASVAHATPLAVDAQRVASGPDFPQKLAENVLVMVAEKLKTAEIRLAPEDLGAVMIRIEMKETGADIRFAVSEPHAATLIEDALPKLRETLGQAGIQLGDTSVSQRDRGQTTAWQDAPAQPRDGENGRGQNGAQSHDQARARGHGGRSGGAEPSASSQDGWGAQYVVRQPRGRVDLFA